MSWMRRCPHNSTIFVAPKKRRKTSLPVDFAPKRWKRRVRSFDPFVDTYLFVWLSIYKNNISKSGSWGGSFTSKFLFSCSKLFQFVSKRYKVSLGLRMFPSPELLAVKFGEEGAHKYVTSLKVCCGLATVHTFWASCSGPCNACYAWLSKFWFQGTLLKPGGQVTNNCMKEAFTTGSCSVMCFSIELSHYVEQYFCSSRL